MARDTTRQARDQTHSSPLGLFGHGACHNACFVPGQIFEDRNEQVRIFQACDREREREREEAAEGEEKKKRERRKESQT